MQVAHLTFKVPYTMCVHRDFKRAVYSHNGLLLSYTNCHLFERTVDCWLSNMPMDSVQTGSTNILNWIRLGVEVTH
ncbi:hypothetical protein I79_016942 [Cricetulus griseus]|uniref:Uncharacterized protein n=1 Tax=Cricetulus griseus TaxID=10029 RepID=G3I0Q3_CRIGR|nr:hypothetical protein I79_016942 [Cricetulus griseus]